MMGPAIAIAGASKLCPGIYLNDIFKIYFDSCFAAFYYSWSNWQWISIGSRDGLKPNGHQTIDCTNDDTIHYSYMRHGASMS